MIYSLDPVSPANLPSPPRSVSVVNLTHATVSISWDPPMRNAELVTGYSLQYVREDEDRPKWVST